MFTIHQVIEKLGVSRGTAYGWIKQYAQFLSPDPMAGNRKGGSAAVARMYTDMDLRVLLLIKELRKQNLTRSEIDAQLTQRLGRLAENYKKRQPAKGQPGSPTTSPLPALIDTQTAPINGKATDHTVIDAQTAMIPAQPEQPKAPEPVQVTDQGREQSIIAKMFPPYGKSAPIDQGVDRVASDPLAESAQVGIVPVNAALSDEPAHPVIVPFKGEVITYPRVAADQPAAPDGMPDDATLIEWLQRERGDLFRVAWGLGGLDQQRLWEHVVRSRVLRPVYLVAKGYSSGGIDMSSQRAAKIRY